MTIMFSGTTVSSANSTRSYIALYFNMKLSLLKMNSKIVLLDLYSKLFLNKVNFRSAFLLKYTLFIPVILILTSVF